MKFLKTTVIGLGLLYLLACNRGSDSNELFADVKNNAIKEEELNKFSNPGGNPNSDSAIQTAPGNRQQPSKPNSVTRIDWNKKIIKIAAVNIEVKNYRSFNDQIHDNIQKHGAYIAQEEQNQTDYKLENTVTIKVPVDQFDNLLASVTSGEHKILEKKITSEDVSTQIVDTKSRMEAKKQVRLKYLELLKQARNMQEILNVENEVNGIQEEIEAASGRIEYLSHASAYSTINLTYFQILDASAKDRSEPAFGNKVWQSFKNGWDWIGDVFIGLISIWPLFVMGFGCWLAYKKWRSSRIRKPAA